MAASVCGMGQHTPSAGTGWSCSSASLVSGNARAPPVSRGGKTPLKPISEQLLSPASQPSLLPATPRLGMKPGVSEHNQGAGRAPEARGRKLTASGLPSTHGCGKLGSVVPRGSFCKGPPRCHQHGPGLSQWLWQQEAKLPWGAVTQPARSDCPQVGCSHKHNAGLSGGSGV